MTITMAEKEIWRPISGFPGYELSNAGRVRNAGRTRILPTFRSGAATSVKLTRKGKKYERAIVLLCEKTFGVRPIDVDLNDGLVARTEELPPIIDYRPHEDVAASDDDEEEVGELNESQQQEALKIPLARDMDEEWLEVPGYPTYLASTWGRVRRQSIINQAGRKQAGIVLNPGRVGETGYRWLKIEQSDGERVGKRLDEIICETFHGPQPSPDHGPFHLDGERENYDWDNLEWREGCAIQRRPEYPEDRKRPTPHSKSPTGPRTTYEENDMTAPEAPAAPIVKTSTSDGETYTLNLKSGGTVSVTVANLSVFGTSDEDYDYIRSLVRQLTGYGS